MAWWRQWPARIPLWIGGRLRDIRTLVFTRRTIGAWIFLMLWLIDRGVNYWSNWEFALAKATIIQRALSEFVVAHSTEANLQWVLLGTGLFWLLVAVRYPKKPKADTVPSGVPTDDNSLWGQNTRAAQAAAALRFASMGAPARPGYKKDLELHYTEAESLKLELEAVPKAPLESETVKQRQQQAWMDFQIWRNRVEHTIRNNDHFDAQLFMNCPDRNVTVPALLGCHMERLSRILQKVSGRSGD